MDKEAFCILRIVHWHLVTWVEVQPACLRTSAFPHSSPLPPVPPPCLAGTNPDLTSSSFLTGRASYVSLMSGCHIMAPTGRIRRMSSCTFLEGRIRVQVLAGFLLLLLHLNPNSFLSHQLNSFLHSCPQQSIRFCQIRGNSPGLPESCEGDLLVFWPIHRDAVDTRARAKHCWPPVQWRSCSSRSAWPSTSTSLPSSSCSTRW